MNAPEDTVLDMETVEAEVVFLIRSRGQWPLHQTEIHFHPSTQVHRGVAAALMARYRPIAKPPERIAALKKVVTSG